MIVVMLLSPTANKFARGPALRSRGRILGDCSMSIQSGFRRVVYGGEVLRKRWTADETVAAQLWYNRTQRHAMQNKTTIPTRMKFMQIRTDATMEGAA